MKARKQSSTSYPITFLMVDSTDHVTGKTGLTPTVTLSKNGGAFASPSGAVSEIGSGWYQLAGNATDRGTIGELLLHATASGADPVDDRYLIVPFDPFDANALGLAYLTGAAALESSVQSVLTRLPAALVGGRMDASVGAMASAVVTAAAIAADAIGASELATDAVAEIVAAVWAATMRTVTGVSGTATLLSAVDGDDVTVWAGDTWSGTVAVTGVTLTDYDTLILAVKQPGQDDADALLVVHSDDGLVTINGAEPDTGDEDEAELTFLAGSFTFTVAMSQTVGLPARRLTYYIKGIANGTPDEGRTLVTGQWTVRAAGVGAIT